jgi:excisionase family DNA binding protein
MDDEWSALRLRTYTLREAAEALRSHPYTLLRLIKAGQVPAKKLGGTWRIPGAFVVDMLRQSK